MYVYIPPWEIGTLEKGCFCRTLSSISHYHSVWSDHHGWSGGLFGEEAHIVLALIKKNFFSFLIFVADVGI
jgi:hypothetical protein